MRIGNAGQLLTDFVALTNLIKGRDHCGVPRVLPRNPSCHIHQKAVGSLPTLAQKAGFSLSLYHFCT